MYILVHCTMPTQVQSAASLEYPPQPKSLSLVKLTYELCSAQSASPQA